MKIAYLIATLAIFSAIVGIYFFGATESTSFLSYLTPVWNFFQSLVNILRTVWQWFMNLIGWVDGILPDPVMEAI